MNRLVLFLVLGCFIISSIGAQVRYEPEDVEVFNRFLQYSKQGENSIVHAALFFIDTPYVGGTLEGDEIEQLRVNLRELDCVTFVENVIALHLMLNSGQHTFDNFCSILQRIRYRDGVIDGYLSRLHYFSEWLDNNRLKGIVTLPALPACQSFNPSVSFMSSNCDAYPALKSNPELCKLISSIEKNVNELNLCYIPKQQVKDLGANLSTGDIIAISTLINGLDIAHTGFAFVQNGKTYLLHASSDLKKVVISDETLHDYLARFRNHSGILTGRVE